MFGEAPHLLPSLSAEFLLLPLRCHPPPAFAPTLPPLLLSLPLPASPRSGSPSLLPARGGRRGSQSPRPIEPISGINPGSSSAVVAWPLNHQHTFVPSTHKMSHTVLLSLPPPTFLTFCGASPHSLCSLVPISWIGGGMG